MYPNLTADPRIASVRAAVDRVIPADDWPGGWEGGVAAYLVESGRDTAWAWSSLFALGERLDALARARGARDFAALPADAQDAGLAGLESDPAAAALVAVLVRVTFEGYYAASEGRRPAGLDMVGFHPVPAGVTPVEPAGVPATPLPAVRRHYDAIIVGSGPGGGVAAQVLTAAGKAVLLVERALDLPNWKLRGDHLHGKRNAVYDSQVGPGPGHPRWVGAPGGDGFTVDGTGDAGLYGLNAMAFGGGSRIWQGMAWRFLAEDFRMASTYGNPEGASLADWPVTYEEMEPYYARAEQELGVAGAEGALTARTPRSGGYPMPPMHSEPSRVLLGRAADRLGWGWGPIPLALNSVPHAGRPACARCPQCVGHACPVDAKNGSHNTFIPRAVATGGCDVLYDAEAVQVEDGPHHATVTVMAAARTAPVELRIGAEVAIISAGAVETPRLLLASGLGNDQLGRHLHDHRTATVLGVAGDVVKPYGGPGHSVATLDHVHGATIPWGGGVIVDLMNLLPLTSANAPDPGVPAWGRAHKTWMRGERARSFGVFGMGQEIPLASSRVTLAAEARDRWGRPGAALRKDVHWASRQVEDGMAAVGRDWLEAAGLTGIRRRVGGPTASAAGEHSCGTARMGTSPEASATDPHGHLHGTRRVVVCDQSLHVTNGSVNPNLTNIANAFRVAEALVADWPR